MTPNLKILPAAQLKLWPQLIDIPKNYILYGGTAIALQLGHRNSVDFDFFSSKPLNKNVLFESLAFLSHAQIVQPEINTLDCFVDIDGDSVKLQFLAGLGNRLGRVDEPLLCDDNHLLVASLRDLLANKLNTIQARAEIKDYLDIYAIIESGISLAEGLGCAKAVFGPNFDVATSLRALCSYSEGTLNHISNEIKNRLIKYSLEIERIPKIERVANEI